MSTVYVKVCLLPLQECTDHTYYNPTAKPEDHAEQLKQQK